MDLLVRVLLVVLRYQLDPVILGAPLVQYDLPIPVAPWVRGALLDLVVLSVLDVLLDLVVLLALVIPEALVAP